MQLNRVISSVLCASGPLFRLVTVLLAPRLAAPKGQTQETPRTGTPLKAHNESFIIVL